MNKNFVTFMILSVAVLVTWDFFFTRPQKQRLQAGRAAAAQAVSVSTEIVKIPAVPRPSERVELTYFESGPHSLAVNLAGGSLHAWNMAEKDGLKAELVPPANHGQWPLFVFPDVEFKVGASTAPHSLALSGDRADGLHVRKLWTVAPEGHIHNITLTLTNRGKTPVDVVYEKGFGPGFGPPRYHGAPPRVLAYAAPRLQNVKESLSAAPYDWWGMDAQYYLAVFLEDGKTPATLTLTHIERQVPNTGFTKMFKSTSLVREYIIKQTVQKTLAPGETVTETAPFYLGPKGYKPLAAHKLGLEKAVDFGFFATFGKIIYYILTGFHKVTGNYGWAVILLTIAVQILLLPLTVRSFQFGQKMKLVQPHVKRLQEIHKGDPQRLNSEMMALYKRHGMKFMGMEGCLPILIQLPVFFALFTTLNNTYELHQAPWIGWITDLSAKDPYYILPIIMGAGMFLQQKMTAASADPMQQQMAVMMPIIMTFVSLQMPVGLVLYWVTGTIVTVTIQLILKKRTEMAAEQPGRRPPAHK